MLYSPAMPTHLFDLYEASVQDVEWDLDFFTSVYRRERGARFDRLREDFCGTARLACTWVQRRPSHRAWGVDLNPATLAWARANHLATLGPAAERVRLVRADVRHSRVPKVDVIAALNCSYWVFKQKSVLVDYVRSAYRGLDARGLLFMDVFGGEGANRTLIERRRVRGTRTFAGERIPPFTYKWEQKRFNPIDHHLLAAIHFELDDGRVLRNAFRYDWRMWTLPELDEAFREAGFRDVQVHVQGWDEVRNRPLDTYHRRRSFENQDGWIAFVVGVK